MIHEDERDALVTNLRDRHLEDPGKLWDEAVNIDGLGLIGVDVATVAFNQTRSRAVMALALLNLVESRLTEAATKLAEDEADVAINNRPRRSRNGAALSRKERENAEDLG